jgi:glycosyltransferase involved in cell wall biosynthesis
MKLNDRVEFLGFIEDNDRIEDIVSHCGVGIAPYEPDKDSYTWYTDPGKPKVYLGCGIPVIIGKVPPVHKLISSRGAGIAIDYDPQQLAEAIFYLTNDEEKYATFKKNALELGREYDWDLIFGESMGRIMKDLNPDR